MLIQYFDLNVVHGGEICKMKQVSCLYIVHLTNTLILPWWQLLIG